VIGFTGSQGVAHGIESICKFCRMPHQPLTLQDILRLLPRGTHDPAMFIKPAELRRGPINAGLVPGPFTGLGPRGMNRRGDMIFGRLPLSTILYMGTARKPATP
jgi:2-polyprenyl-6-hydroxyphenyl methylase / 3-demethylubiquinone-9 3-methyltransferase